MSKKKSEIELEIPPECYVVKARFLTQPDNAVVKEIKNFIMMTGQPHMWPGHTHSPPLDGDIPVYLDEFELPEKYIKLRYFAPCPCCTPRHAKFGKGKIAWFPIEGVIRLIGPHCFAALNKDGHENALTEMRQRKLREAAITYLLKHHDRLLRAARNVRDAMHVAKAIDEFSGHLEYTVDKRLDLPLWGHVRQGFLPIWEKFTELRKGGAGFDELTRSRSYAPLRGHRMLSPNLPSYSLRLGQVVAGLNKVFEADDWQSQITSMSDGDRYKLAKLIHASLKRGRDLVAEMKELQRFVETLNVATLRNWGIHPDNPVPVHFDRSGMAIKIGKNINALITIPIPVGLEDELREIDAPKLGELD